MKRTLLVLASALFVCVASGGGFSEAQAADNQSLATETQRKTQITGKVVDPQGQPIVGVAVVEAAAATNGTTTNADGQFTITVAEGAPLQVSFIGYKTVTAPARAGMEVTLEEDTIGIDDVVVVGYGVQKKANLSGAVATVKMDEVLGDRPQPNVAAALQGAIPGLAISSGSNQPGQTGKSIQIRGTASFSNKTDGVSGIAPLILIDNVPGDIDALNPDDIESVTVLKDASSSAIYGARAAAGVILITTKRPKGAEAIHVNYNNNFGFVKAINTPEQLRLEEYLPIYKETLNTTTFAGGAGQNIDTWLEYLDVARKNPSQLGGLGTYYPETGILVSDADNKRYYLNQKDIYDRMMETGFSQNHNFSVSGATERIRFRASGNSYLENGPLTGDKDKYSRMSFNGTISADVTKWYTQEADFFFSQQKRTYLNDESGFLYSTRLQNFLPDGIDPDGYIIKTPRGIIENSNARHTTIDTPRFFFKSIFRPVKGLEAIFEYTYQKDRKSVV